MALQSRSGYSTVEYPGSVQMHPTNQRTPARACAFSLAMGVVVGALSGGMKDTNERCLFRVVLFALTIQAALAILAESLAIRTGACVGLLLLAFTAWSLRGRRLLAQTEVAAMQGAQTQLKDTVREKDAELVVAHEQLKEEHLEQRWKNQALEHQLYYADLIINSIADAVVIVSKAMKITRVNSTLLHQTGFTQSELIGKPLEQVVRPAFEGGRDQKDLITIALREERELTDRNAYLVAKNGTITQTGLHLSLMRDSGQVVAGVLALRLQSKTIPGAQTNGAAKSA